VKKDEEKTRKKQGEKGTNKRCGNYEGHVDLTGRYEFICSVPVHNRDNALYTAVVWGNTEEPEGADCGRDIQASIV